MNGMKLAGFVFILAALGLALVAVRQYGDEADVARLQARQIQQQMSSDKVPEAVDPARWEVAALGAVVMAALGAICLAKSRPVQDF